MFQPFLIGQLKGYVSAWSKMVREDRAEAEYCVETFENLCHHTDQGTECDNIFWGMRQQMQLDLRENLGWVKYSECIQHIPGGNTNIILHQHRFSGGQFFAKIHAHNIPSYHVSPGTKAALTARRQRAKWQIARD